MPIPAPAILISQTKANYGQTLGPEAEEYLNALFKAVCDGWKSWQDTIKFGGFAVSGGGVGAWAGSGISGMMMGSGYTMPSFSFKANSPQQVKFTNGLASTLAQKFTAFPSSYKIPSAMFTGVSGATPITPGPVSAQMTPAPMTIGMGVNPSGIADIWKSTLTPPDFDMENPQGKSAALIKAISKAIEMAFQTTWLATTMLSGNTLTAAGAPGGVVVAAISPFDGKLL